MYIWLVARSKLNSFDEADLTETGFVMFLRKSKLFNTRNQILKTLPLYAFI